MANEDRDDVEPSADKLLLIRKNFEAALNSCPLESAPRQRVLCERRNGFVFLQIVSTFKLTDDLPKNNLARQNGNKRS